METIENTPITPESVLSLIREMSLDFDKGVEEESIKEGVAIIKQVGDTVVISEENLKTF